MSSRNWLLLLLAITIVVRLPTMFGVKRSGWDERAYVVFAQTLNDRGLSGIRQILHDYPTNESLKKSPLPLRIGFIVPAMLTCKILGGFDVNNLAWFSFLSGIGFVLVGARFAENLGDRKTSILCGILLITSPLASGLSRRAMQDSFAALLIIACLYFFDQCWRRRAFIDLAAFGILLCLALLTKESTLLLYPMMAIAALYYYRAIKLRTSRWLLVPLLAAPVFYLLIEIGICGGLGNFINTYRIYASLQQTLDYTAHYEKGPWFRYLLDFFAIAPAVFIAAIIGFAVPATNPVRHGRNLALIYLATGILFFGQMPVVNVRLILYLDMFIRFGAAISIIYIASQFGTKWSRRVLVAAMTLVVFADAAQFYQVFVLGKVYSPTTFLLLRAEGFYDAQ